MFKLAPLPLLFALTAAGGIHLAAENTDGRTADPVSPEVFYQELISNPHLETNNNGEPFAWHASGGESFVAGYKVWKDTAWLDFAVKYYDFLLDHMKATPDGYKGMLGRNFRHSLWNDEEVSDALILNQILPFSELVLNDSALKKTYGSAAQRYVDYAKINVIEKWDSRGLWHEIGEYGDYIFSSQFVDPKNVDQWVVDRKNGSAGMSQKFNIANKLGVTNIFLYRITGDESYRDKAEKLFYRLKSDFQLIEDHYHWHYWMPFYEGDVFFDTKSLIHWTAVHPFRPGYQSTEVGQIVEAYHNGIVFSALDIQRIINTNLKVMWNGDFENPSFDNSNGEKAAKSKLAADFQKSHSGSGAQANKGTLWSSLKDFDPTIRTLYEKTMANPTHNKARIQAAYYEKFVKPTEPSFERHHSDTLKVVEKETLFGTSAALVIAKVIPHIIESGTPAVILTKSIQTGPLTIDLYTADGKTLLQSLYEGDIEGNGDGQKGFRMVQWDGTDSTGKSSLSGDYRVRWTFPDGYRDYAIQITVPSI